MTSHSLLAFHSDTAFDSRPAGVERRPESGHSRHARNSAAAPSALHPADTVDAHGRLLRVGPPPPMSLVSVLPGLGRRWRSRTIAGSNNFRHQDGTLRDALQYL